MNLILVGPCGVGKSSVCCGLKTKYDLDYLDYDEYRTIEMKHPTGCGSQHSIRGLNLEKSLSPRLSKYSKDFVLDIGGDTIFRDKVDNKKRLIELLSLKQKYSAKIIVLTASKNVLQCRFMKAKNRDKSYLFNDDFEKSWDNWERIAKQFYQLCGDIFIETSSLSTKDVVSQISRELNLNNHEES